MSVRFGDDDLEGACLAITKLAADVVLVLLKEVEHRLRRRRRRPNYYGGSEWSKSGEEERGEDGHVAGADIRSHQPYATICRQTPPGQDRVRAARQGPTDHDIHRHAFSHSNNGSSRRRAICAKIASFAPRRRLSCLPLVREK